MPVIVGHSMSAETRAVMRAMLEALRAKSTDFWEFKAEGENEVSVCKGDDLAFIVHSTSKRVKLWIDCELLDPYLVPEDDDVQEFKNGNRVRMIQVGPHVKMCLEQRDDYWVYHFKPDKYEDRKQYVVQLMLIAQAACLVRMMTA